MKISITKTVEYEAKYLKAELGVRYWEDADLNGVEDTDGKMPLREGDYWTIFIDIEAGKIQNWPEGNVASIHYKVCDDGYYTLYTEKLEEICKKDGYVPDFLSPKESGYGDYVIMDILEDGKIDRWRFDPEFFTDEY